MISCHSHSGEYCKHGHGKLMDCVKKAAELNFKIYCLTEHMPRSRIEDLYPEELECNMKPEDTWEMFESFYAEAKTIQSSVEIFVGMEIEWIHENTFNELRNIRSKFDLDFVIGSVHHIDGVPIDYDRDTFQYLENQYEPEELFCKYFDTQFEMLKAVQPLIVGHFDLIRLFSSNHYLSPKVINLVHRNIDYINYYGGIIEINSRAYKKSLPDAYPFRDILQIMIEKKCKFTISDDAHGPNDVGMYYNKLHQYLQLMGIHEIWAPMRTANAIGIRRFDLNEILGMF